jgi:single stranded DNA-binding protein
MSQNQIFISGNLGSDPEIKQVKDFQLCTFSLAHTPWSKTKGDGETIWFRVNIWGDKGDAIARELRKGDSVSVVGKFGVSKYTAKDGTEKTSNEITASDISITIKAARSTSSYGKVASIEDVPGW